VTLDEWTQLAAGVLDVPAPDAETQRLLLDVAREVAHHTVRPGAPLAAYLIGVAVGRGATLEQAAETVTVAAHRHGSAPPPT
jgi:hypothetical protein